MGGSLNGPFRTRKNIAFSFSTDCGTAVIFVDVSDKKYVVSEEKSIVKPAEVKDDVDEVDTSKKEPLINKGTGPRSLLIPHKTNLPNQLTTQFANW